MEQYSAGLFGFGDHELFGDDLIGDPCGEVGETSEELPESADSSDGVTPWVLGAVFLLSAERRKAFRRTTSTHGLWTRL